MKYALVCDFGSSKPEYDLYFGNSFVRYWSVAEHGPLPNDWRVLSSHPESAKELDANLRIPLKITIARPIYYKVRLEGKLYLHNDAVALMMQYGYTRDEAEVYIYDLPTFWVESFQ